MELGPAVYYKCTACSNCLLSEESFYVHTRTNHCKLLINEGHNYDGDLLDNFADAENDSSENSNYALHSTQSHISNNAVIPCAESISFAGDAETCDVTKDKTDDDCSDLQDIKPNIALAYSSDSLNNSDNIENDNGELFKDNVNFHCDSTVVSEVPSAASNKMEERNDAEQVFSLESHKLVSVGNSSGRSCRWCNKVIKQRTKLVEHERIHTGDRPYKCQVCEKSFARLDGLKIHIRMHTGERPYHCKVCYKQFYDHSGLNYHKKYVHRTGSIRGQLTESARSTANDSIPAQSEIRKEPKKPHCCRFCQRAFRQRTKCLAHERIHTGHKPYECAVCHKTFSREDGLRMHARTHTGIKPYKCDICNRQYSDRSGLNYHKKVIHAQGPSTNAHGRTKTHGIDATMKQRKNPVVEQPESKPMFFCQWCGKTFLKRCLLEVHVRQHTGHKPYECEVCPKRFSRSDILKTHIRTHTGERPYHCNMCEKQFYDRSGLSSHKKRKHNTQQ